MILTPRAAVEDTSDGREQDVSPVEQSGSFIEVGKAEEDGGDEQCGGPADAALEEILDPAAKEDFLRQGHTDEGEDPGGDDEPGVVDVVVEVEESESESEGNGDGQVEEKFTEADAPVAPAEPKIVADARETTDSEEGVETGVEQREFAEEAEFMGPGGFEPAEVDAKAEGNEDEKVEEMAALGRVEFGC